MPPISDHYDEATGPSPAHTLADGTAALPELRRARTPSLGDPGGGMKFPTPDTVRDRFDGEGVPLPPDPAWAEHLAACARERCTQLTPPGFADNRAGGDE